MTRVLAAIACLSGLMFLAGPTLGSAQTEAPATGWALWVRAPGRSVQDLVSSAVGAPQFTVGFRRPRLTLGLGVGFSTVRSSDKDSFDDTEDRISATAFQAGPSGFMDIWHSTDQRVRGQIAAGIVLGRLSATETDQFRDFNGVLQTTTTKTTGTLIGFHAALAGEYFLHPHFALGVEGGFQGTFAVSIEEQGANETVGVGANGAYGALRAMIVF